MATKKSEEQKVDYMALRKLYTRNNNQAGIDNLVRIIFDNVPQKEERKKLLAGIKVSNELVNSICLPEISELLFSGATPKETLVNRAKNYNPEFYITEEYDKLYRAGFISIQDLQKVILGIKDIYLSRGEYPSWVRNIYYLFKKDDLSPYEGLDFKWIIKCLLSYVGGCRADSAVYGEAMYETYCAILSKVPYDEDYSNYVRRYILSGESYRDNELILTTTLDKMLSGKSTIEIIETIYSRPDLTEIFLKSSIARRFLMGTIDSEELFSLLSQGKIRPVGLVLTLFYTFKSRRNELINNWIANELELEIDIYMEKMLNGVIYIDYGELDKKHIGALEEEKAKQFEIKPTEQQ